MKPKVNKIAISQNRGQNFTLLVRRSNTIHSLPKKLKPKKYVDKKTYEKR